MALSLDTGRTLAHALGAPQRPEVHDPGGSIVLTGRSAAWLAHVLWEHEVAGSNPAAPTVGPYTPAMTARRTALASFVLAAMLAVLGVASAFAAPERAPAELLPDLVTRPFDGVSIQKAGDRTLLRFGNSIGNQGPGVLELRPRRRDCNGDGDFTNDRLALERIYADTNGSGGFERGIDLVGRTVEVGCMVFHPAHDHWHLQRFARYELRSIATGTVVVASPKVSFCVRDSLVAFPGLPGFSSLAYYGGCKRNSITGLSVGWADWYAAFLPGQDLEVTGLPNGRYCLTSTADPRDGIDEADETNNVRSRLLRLSDGAVEDLGVGC